MSTRGSALQRTINYFRECTIDEARVTFQLVKEVVDQRLKENGKAARSQAKAAGTARRKRRTKAEMAASRGGGQSTLPMSA